MRLVKDNAFMLQQLDARPKPEVDNCTHSVIALCVHNQ